MKAALIAVDKIDVPEGVERPTDHVADDMTRKSIESGGIQQPLVLVPGEGNRYLLVDGLRRLRIARAIGINKVPAVIDSIPKEETAESYIRKLRFILDHHRQDLLPSQKAEMIETLKAMFGMNHKQVAAYLGVDQDSITNWMAVKHYIPEVVTALDTGNLTMQAARAFDGMTEEGQRTVWNRDGKKLMRGGGKLHKEIRAQYSPTEHPEMYRNPELVAARLARKSPAKRKVNHRLPVPANEKKLLMNSLEIKETELKDGREKMKQLEREIMAATPVIAAIMRNEKLLSHVPDDMKQEFDRFAEIYV